MKRATILAAAILLTASAAARADWPTCRGNVTRTGNLDGQAGPATPHVLWVYKAQEHFIAAPVVGDAMLFVSGLGAFNTGVFHGLSLEPDAKQRALWSKAAPLIKMPVVSAPAMVDGLVVFGDGIHQTDGATLYCVQEKDGRPVWQYPMPGKLIHLEGSPTIEKGRVYIGGGDAGVICVDLKKVTLDGKEQELPAVQAAIEKAWAALQAKYEDDKKKDPTFAIPPNEDALPKPAPKLYWQAGKGKWHVDAPVAVVGERLLAASAYLDDEKIGNRCLASVNIADGKPQWETPLKFNPWAGPTVVGNMALVGCSSIRFDKKLVKDAKGSVAAIDINNGQIKWEKEFPGGVLSTVAATNDLAICAATDGKVRALAVYNGEVKWTYDAHNAIFSAPAIAGKVAYVADLKCVLHAISLADGTSLWTLDLAGYLQTAGMVFGSPVVAGGNVYLATCNIEGDNANQPCAVVCVSDKSAAGGGSAAIAVDKDKRTITIPCRIAPRKLPTLNEIYPLEVAATYPTPRGLKAHETVVIFDIKPSDVAKALESFGLKPGKCAQSEDPPVGPEVRIYLEVEGVTPDKPRRIPLEKAIVDRRTGKILPEMKWHFTGSVMRQPDPDKPDKVYGADAGGTLVTLFPVTDETVIQCSLGMKESSLLKLEINRNVLPDEGTPVKMVIEAMPPETKAGGKN